MSFIDLTLMGIQVKPRYFPSVRKFLRESPLVSITFPIHKFSEFAEEALKSILVQSYKNIEVMFLDNSKEDLRTRMQLNDSRIKYFKLPESFGLSDTLNFSLINATGKYLARMDYDDISLPNRVETQVRFMEEHSEVSISGCSIEIIGAAIDEHVGPGEIVHRPTTHEELLIHLVSKNPFFHPTVIFRLEDVRRHKLYYNTKYDSAEDLELWSRASHKVKLANLNVVLLKYRIHPLQYSRLDGLNSSRCALKVSVGHTFWMVKKHKISVFNGIKILLAYLKKYLPLEYKYWRSEKFKKFG